MGRSHLPFSYFPLFVRTKTLSKSRAVQLFLSISSETRRQSRKNGNVTVMPLPMSPLSQNAGFTSYRYFSSICGEKNRWEKKWKKSSYSRDSCSSNNHPAYKSKQHPHKGAASPSIFGEHRGLFLSHLGACRAFFEHVILCDVISFLERRRCSL